MQKLNPHVVALAVLGILLIGTLIFIFTGGGSGEDRLGDDQATAQVSAEDPEARCAEPGHVDRIKRALFERAAESRPDDREAFGRLAQVAVLRAETPIARGYDQRQEQISCSAYVSLDLPPGVSAGGRRTLTGEVGYVLQGGSLSLRDADSVTSALALLARDGQAPDAGLSEAESTAEDLGAETPAGNEPVDDLAPQPEPATVYPGRPSFNCDRASTRGEVAVCENPGLAMLDVQMAADYRRAVANASPRQRSQLNQTRDRFLTYRDRCPTIGCIRDAYEGRMREIRDIMADR